MEFDDAQGQSAQLAREVDALRERVERLEREVAGLLRPGRSPAVPPPPLDTRVPPPEPPAFTLSAVPQISFEDRLGSQWFSRIGVLTLLIATALFLKLAIDKHWIGPVGRVVCGLAGGAAVVVWSERFQRQGVRAFSFALKAVGSGVLYLSLWAAFQLYHLLPGPVALGAMVLVTAWNAFMAWSQDTELLAAYALIGGMATPALLSTGGNHEVFLFTYLAVIGLATALLVRLKRWPRLLLGVFPATVAYFISWYAGFYVAASLARTATFLLLFGAIFAAVSLGEERPPAAGPQDLIATLLLPLANAAFVALGLYSVLQDSGHHALLAWLMLSLSAVYLSLMRLPLAGITAAAHLSVAVVFLSVAIPLKASGRGIVIAWLVEGAALLWAAARQPNTRTSDGLLAKTALRRLACAALGLGFIGVVSAPAWYTPPSEELVAFFNWRFGTGLAGLATFAAALRVALHASAQHEEQDRRAPWRRIAVGSVVAFNIIALWAVVQEIDTVWRTTATSIDAKLQRDLAISAFLMVYSAALLAGGFRRRSAFVRWQGLVLLVFTIGKTFLYDLHSLSEGYRVVSVLALGVLLLGVSFAYQRDWLGLRQPSSAPAERP